MLTISKELFESWNKAELLYCHWKSNEHLLPGLNGTTDLDVLLSIDDKEAGEEILKRLDFLKCKSQYGSRYPGVDDWIGFDKETGALIHLHLHYRLATGHKGLKEYSLPWTDIALNSRVLNEEYRVYTMEPNLELVTLYTRIGLKVDFVTLIRSRTKNFKLGEDVYKEIYWLKERADMQKVQQLIETFYAKYASQMMGIINDETISAERYLQLRKITERNFKNCSSVASFVRLREVGYFVYHHFFKKKVTKIKPVMARKVPISGKGLTVAFLGQDGAGKTTVTKELIKWWKWKLDVRYVYLGSGENYFSIKKRLSQSIPPKGIFKYFRAMLGLSVLKDVARQSYRNVLKAEKYAEKGGLVIYDRFPQTEYASICDGPKIRKKINDYFGKGILSRLFIPMAIKEERWINKTVSHQPNVVIKLVLPPEESIRRKPHENYEAVKKKHEIVKSLRFEDSDVYTIDATMPYEQEMITIKNIIWQHIHK